jgi:hypothetical protein
MREMTKAEQLFCKEYGKMHQPLSPEVVDGVNVLLDKEPMVCHARTKIAIVIVQHGTDICAVIRHLSLMNYHVMPFTEDEVMEDSSKMAALAFATICPLIGDIEDYGFYCACHPEKMKEVLRGAWEGL